LLDTRAAGEAIERAEIRGRHECVESARRIAPQLNSEIVEIAGGAVPFAGVGSPLSEAVGLGTFAEVTGRDVDALTDFYVRRGTPPRVAVMPLASPDLFDELVRAGYRPVEHQNVLAREISSVDCERDERIVESHDPWTWGRASASGFAGRDPSDDDVVVGAIIAAIPSVTALELRIGGSVAATGAMDVQGEYAALFAASTATAARGRGFQTALIRDRIARARERGARVAHAGAGVASPSERNFRRLGFTVLFTRSIWEKPLCIG
jgi:GNAT superfamily N-acetyltransferase